MRTRFLSDLFKKEIQKGSELFDNLFLINEKVIKYILTYIKYFHQLLYDTETIIHLQFDERNIKLSFLFYFDILIKFNSYINYDYSYKDIVKINNIKDILKQNIINNKEKNENINNIILIIIVKIIDDFIYNYKGFENYDDDIYQKILFPIEEENKKIINNNIHYLKQLNYNEKDIGKKNIDEIYLEAIIIPLIIEKEDYKNAEILLESLDLKSMDITKEMKEKIYKILSSEQSLNKYIITEDKKIERKINFYFLLLKYILKDSIDIYQISLFLISRKNILKLIKYDKFKLYFSDVEIFLKMKFILNKLLDSKYYEIKYLDDIFVSTHRKNKDNNSNYTNINTQDNKVEILSLKYDGIMTVDAKKNESIFINGMKGIFNVRLKIKDGSKILANVLTVNEINASEKIKKDILIFYDPNERRIVKEIKGYYFSQGETSIEIIDNEKYKILLCSCKQDLNKEKNGVLIIYLDILNNKNRIKDKEYFKFIQKDFSVESIYNVKNSTKELLSSNSYINSNNCIYHNYILLGGKDDRNNKGIVKLFRFIFDGGSSKFELEDLEIIDSIKNFNGFTGSVNYIKQNSSNEELVIGFDKLYYRFRKPNLDKYYYNNNYDNSGLSYFNNSNL